MAARKEPPLELPLSFDEAYKDLSSQMRSLHISRVDEMPRIELYLDQVLSIVGMELGFMYGPDEKIVTGSMVNNYVKQHVIPAPLRKRYTRRHLATLLFVCAFKRVLSISQIAEVFAMAREADVDVEMAYDELIGLLEQALAVLFHEDPAVRPTAGPIEVRLVDSAGNRCAGTLERLLENAVVLLACKVYADRMIALEAQCGGASIQL